MEGGTTDQFKHVGGPGLLPQGLPQFIEQPRVLNRDYSLVGESGDQLGLLVGKWVRLSAAKRKDTDRRSLRQEWHAQGPSVSCRFLMKRRPVIGIGQYVRNMDCPAF